ncbi:2,3-butanediol dehydrogenase [Ascoidea rubescens DSM 1968]|uniref:GroES-like protein n=1 Tax=Ascoidea rubescens DSM 1968 TaxID=1344418 RepID=A0A1D2VR48_9ASCO|nr:GroES-like protein [Ascoidea rubescens DSM 1968]ODV64082.1 GroES-like protein [Ascoidea rubescens DSM 1968]
MSDTMKGLLYYGKNDLRYSPEIPIPVINDPDEVMIKVHWCGICGTDLLEYIKGPVFFTKIDEKTGHPMTGIKLPQTMGHELSGEIVELGPNVKNIRDDLSVGDNVVCEPTIYCKDKKRFPNSLVNKSSPHGSEECESCNLGYTNICKDSAIFGLGAHPGGLAEYVVVGAHHIVKVPDWIPLDVAALVQPLAVSFHSVRVNTFKPGSSAVVVGAGAIGLGCILAASAFDASLIVCSEPAKVRREQAALLGATTFNPFDYKDNDEAVRELKKLSPNGAGFDLAFDCSGFPITFDTALAVLKPRGELVNLAIWPHKPIDLYPMDFTNGEKKITGSMCYTVEDFAGVIEAMDKGKMPLEKLRKLITKKVEIQNGVEGGFKELYQNKDKHIKILISPLKINENGDAVKE